MCVSRVYGRIAFYLMDICLLKKCHYCNDVFVLRQSNENSPQWTEWFELTLLLSKIFENVWFSVKKKKRRVKTVDMNTECRTMWVAKDICAYLHHGNSVEEGLSKFAIRDVKQSTIYVIVTTTMALCIKHQRMATTFHFIIRWNNNSHSIVIT